MKSQKTKLLNQILKKGLVLYLKSHGSLFKRNGAISSETVELFPKDINTSRMKELWPHFIVVWFIFLSVTQAKYGHLRKGNTRSVGTFNQKRKLEYQYPCRTSVYFRRLTKAARHVRGNTAEFYTNINQRSKRRKRARPLRAIHIWGTTPFKTMLQNLLRLNNNNDNNNNDNIQKQRGAEERLLISVQPKRLQLLSALGNSPFPGQEGLYLHRFSTFPPAGHFHVAPDDIHLQEGPPAVSYVPGPVRFAPPTMPVPSETFVPFHEQAPIHMQESGLVHDFLPVDEVPSIKEISPMHEMEPDNVMAPSNDDGPDRKIAPMRELEAAQDMPPISELDPTSQSFDKSLNIAPNFEPPFPWMARELQEEVNRHVNKGKLL